MTSPQARLLLTALSLSSISAVPDPDLPFSPIQDPEDPDFSGIVDFSNATPGPDGSWCITKVSCWEVISGEGFVLQVKYVDHMENDQVKECWHQNVTQCHDTYITEFLPSQEQKCEETFWKSCKIDFKEVPFNYSLKQCHTPLVKVPVVGQGGFQLSDGHHYRNARSIPRSTEPLGRPSAGLGLSLSVTQPT